VSSKIASSLPLPRGKQPQEPGVVPDEVLAAMEHHIGKLPKKKDYTTKNVNQSLCFPKQKGLCIACASHVLKAFTH
jgi:hypothetical protein